MGFFKPKSATFQTPEQGFNVAVATHKKINLVIRTQVKKLQRKKSQHRREE